MLQNIQERLRRILPTQQDPHRLASYDLMESKPLGTPKVPRLVGFSEMGFGAMLAIESFGPISRGEFGGAALLCLGILAYFRGVSWWAKGNYIESVTNHLNSLKQA